MAQEFNYYHIGKGRLTLTKFKQLVIIDRLYIEDEVVGIVHAPSFKEDYSNTYYLVIREDNLMRIRYNNPTFTRIPYGSVPDNEFLSLYKMTKTQHQSSHWRWKEKIEGKTFTAFHL